MTDDAREWTAAHLPWLVVALVVLWLPPVAYTVAVDVGFVGGAGYPSLTDPAVALPVVELAFLLSAIRPLLRRDRTGWSRLAWSRVIVLVQTVWLIAITVRLSGAGAVLSNRPVVEALAGLVVAAALLGWTRPMYGRAGRNRAV